MFSVWRQICYFQDMREREKEWLAKPRHESFWVDIDTGLGVSEIQMSRTAHEKLNHNAQDWMDLYEQCRFRLGRESYAGYYNLTQVTLSPFTRIDGRSAAIAITGKYMVQDDVKISQNETAHIVHEDNDKDPIIVDLETFGGNFDYFQAIVDGDIPVVIELTPEFSEHIAEIMLEYYRQLPPPSRMRYTN